MPEYILKDILYEFLCDLIMDADQTLKAAKGIQTGFSRDINISNYVQQISRGSQLDRTLGQFQLAYPFYDTLYGIYVRKFFANLLVASSDDIIMVTDEELLDPSGVSYAIDTTAYGNMFMTSSSFFKEFLRRFVSRDLTEMTRNIIAGVKPLSEPILSLVRIVSVISVYDALQDCLVNGIYVYRIMATPESSTGAVAGGNIDVYAEDTLDDDDADHELSGSDSDSDADEEKSKGITINIDNGASVPGLPGAVTGIGYGTESLPRDNDTESVKSGRSGSSIERGTYRGLADTADVIPDIAGYTMFVEDDTSD